MECDLDWRRRAPHLHSSSIHQHSTDHYNNKSRLKNWHTESDRPLWTHSLTQDHIIFSNPHILCTSPLVRTKDWWIEEEYFFPETVQIIFDMYWSHVEIRGRHRPNETKRRFSPYQRIKQNPSKVIAVFISQNFTLLWTEPWTLLK